MMEGWTNPDPYVTKVEDVICRDCGKTFQINAQYDKNGFPVFFRAKYCSECNMKPKITGPNGSWGTVNIESAKVPQKNVEGLEESLQTLATSIINDRGEFRAFKKHAEHDIEQNKLKLENFLDIQIGVNDRVNERFTDAKLNLDVFKSSQAEFNTKQADFNISILKLVREIHKFLIVIFSAFIFFMLATWGYLTYTFFKH
jgi:hypothetical protein